MAKHIVVLSHRGRASKIDGLIPAHVVDVWDQADWVNQYHTGTNPTINYEHAFQGSTVSLRYYLMDYGVDEFPKYFKPTGRRYAKV